MNKNKNYDLIPEDWTCQNCGRGKKDVGFQVVINKILPPCVGGNCNVCRNKRETKYKTREERKIVSLRRRIEISSEIRDYFKQG